MKSKLVAGVALAAVLGLVMPARTADTGSIYEWLSAEGNHAVLAVAAKEAGATATLSGTTSYTLFAPTDAAFKKLDDAAIVAIATKKSTVEQLLNSHLVAGKYTAAELKKMDGKELPTVSGSRLKVENAKDGLRVGGAKITVADIVCSNGVVHVTDGLLFTPKE